MFLKLLSGKVLDTSLDIYYSKDRGRMASKGLLQSGQ